MRKIVVACDSFKGSLSSREANRAVAEGIREASGDCETVCVEVADGGEGTAEVLTMSLGGKPVKASVHGPLMRQVEAGYGIAGDTAIMEMAAASGLGLLSENERNPLMTSTFGTGEMILDALGKGCRRFILGIGGSATNDGGTGMLSALGYRFLNACGEVLPCAGGSLHLIRSIDCSGANPSLAGCSFKVACDVRATFCGPDGATYVFGHQKGASDEDIEVLEKGMVNLAEIIERQTRIDISKMPGAGAAGGLGGALYAFLGAELVPGADLVLDTLGFRDTISGADLVITGEGCLDSQTAMGKVPAGVLRRCVEKGIPCIAVGGRLKARDTLLASGFASCHSITPDWMDDSAAMRPETAFSNLRRTVRKIISGNCSITHKTV
ncbi:MAG: glycerate kinase [Candidatus Cryptobacteroides sp.]